MPLRISASFLLGATLFIGSALASNVLADTLDYNVAAQGGFVVSLCRDRRGNLWAGTEDKGVACFDGKTWTSFGVKDGLGDDNAYAVTGDQLGRVWVGHLNHGVSVWNGRAWKNYGVGQGPLGERVFALAVSPSNGDVWVATNAGLSRYSVTKNLWTHFSRATGMPTDELSCLAFDSIGRLFIGTQCEGILIGSPDDEFKSWHQIKGSDTLPITATGEGLPSNHINDILVCDDESLYAATSTGLAHSKDFGETWDFLRGADWRQKAAGLRVPISTPEPAGNITHQLLREDYVTNLAEDAHGLLWIGYRRQGYEARRPLVDRSSFLSPAQNDGNFPYISAMLPVSEDAVALGYYNTGVGLSERVPRFAPTQAEQKAAAERRGWKDNFDPATPVAPFPKAAAEPDAAELQRLLALVQNHPKTPQSASPVALMPDDWATQGDWLGRYGRHFADLCAMISPEDLSWGAGAQPVALKWNLGPNHSDDDSTRYWVHTMQTGNRRSLEMPPMYGDSRLVKGFEKDPNQLRRQSEVDDHGEAYPMEHEGPNLRCVLKIPEGNFVLSLYNYNKDGHDDFNRTRDYEISIRPHDPKLSIRDTSDFDKQPELARSRQRDFWGGAWKRFFVRGPQELSIEVNRNYSFNTIMAGVFLDPLEEEPFPYFNLHAGLNEKTDTEDLRSTRLKSDSPTIEAAEDLWAALETARRDDPQWWCSSSRLFYGALNLSYEAARVRTSSDEMSKLWVRLGTCRRALDALDGWEETQRRRGLVPSHDIEHAIRWDGRFDDRGAGFESVMAYSTAKAGLDWWEKNKTDFETKVKAQPK